MTNPTSLSEPSLPYPLGLFSIRKRKILPEPSLMPKSSPKLPSPAPKSSLPWVPFEIDPLYSGDAQPRNHRLFSPPEVYSDNYDETPTDRRFRKLESKVSGLEETVSGLRKEAYGLKEGAFGLREEVSGLKREVFGLRVKISVLKDEVLRLKSADIIRLNIMTALDDKNLATAKMVTALQEMVMKLCDKTNTFGESAAYSSAIREKPRLSW